MTKIYSPLFLKREQEYFLGCYTEPKPIRSETPGFGYSYQAALEKWEKSYKEVRIHPTQINAFIDLADRLIGKGIGLTEFLKRLGVGIELPPENIEIGMDENKGNAAVSGQLYAFLVEGKKEPNDWGEIMYGKKETPEEKCENCGGITKHWPECGSLGGSLIENTKESFYKYGESLGIKINDLQRLALLLKVENKDQEELQSELFSLANKFAIAGLGDIAVRLHQIHNEL